MKHEKCCNEMIKWERYIILKLQYNFYYKIKATKEIIDIKY